MHFELTSALVNQLMFAMEDQDRPHALDCERGEVLPFDEVDESEDSGRFEPIPEWRPADGFRLMERFAASLHNPVVRVELTDALERGRGVFRAFKNVLQAHPEVEKLWHGFKEKELRRRVLVWYNALRERWGLERVGEEPEETEDLVLQDFRIRPATEDDTSAAMELHGQIVDELVVSCPLPGAVSEAEPPSTRLWRSCVRAGLALVAETATGDLAAAVLVEPLPPLAVVRMLDVSPSYRGLGLGQALLERLLEQAGASLRSSGCEAISIDLPQSAESFTRVLARAGFGAVQTRYCLSLLE